MTYNPEKYKSHIREFLKKKYKKEPQESYIEGLERILYNHPALAYFEPTERFYEICLNRLLKVVDKMEKEYRQL